MDAHQNARSNLHSRLLIVHRLESGCSVKAVADALRIDPRTVRKWRDRFAGQGGAVLQDRLSRPHRSPAHLDAAAVGEIERLRRERLSGPTIARQTRRLRSTVSAVLRRLGLRWLKALDPKPPVIRYERDRPGELIHIDIKNCTTVQGFVRKTTPPVSDR